MPKEAPLTVAVRSQKGVSITSDPLSLPFLWSLFLKKPSSFSLFPFFLPLFEPPYPTCNEGGVPIVVFIFSMGLSFYIFIFARGVLAVFQAVFSLSLSLSLSLPFSIQL